MTVRMRDKEIHTPPLLLLCGCGGEILLDVQTNLTPVSARRGSAGLRRDMQ
jgi:hypothetical protein